MAKKKEGTKKGKDRKVILSCSICKEQNYRAVKSKKFTTDGGKLALSKYCRRCRKVTEHKETKVKKGKKK